MRLCIVLRSYGGDNDKNRPDFYSKDLALASFLRAAQAVGAYGAQRGVDVRVVFANDGPIPRYRAEAMQRVGELRHTENGPVGLLDSYRFALDLPDALGLADDDVIAYVEDDYLLLQDAFMALIDGALELPQVQYFAISGSRPTDMSDKAQRAFHGAPQVWHALPDLEAGGRTWINIMSVTSTYAARVGALRADRDIHELAMRPFRNRFLDHEMCLIYQGIRPYHGKDYFFGLPGDFVPGLRGVARAVRLLPYRFELNARARAQKSPHPLYAVAPPVAVHLELGMMWPDHDWRSEAEGVRAWARDSGFEMREAHRPV